MASGTPIILYGRLYMNHEARIEEVDTFVGVKDGSVFSNGNEVIVPASGETAEDIAIASHVARSGIILGSDLNVVEPKSELNPTFLAIGLSNGQPHRQLASRAQGKSIVHIHGSDIAKINFVYPDIKEQQYIYIFFQQLDAFITLHQRKPK